MKSSEKVYYLFWIFIIGCVVGYVVEGIFSLIKWKEFINHSAVVIGPFNAAYGLGALMLSALLYKFKDDKVWKIFIIGFIGGSILEYIMSLGMELVLGFTAWDYSRKPFNINGRITGVAINRAREKEKGVPAKYKYEEILDKTFNKEYLKNMYNDSWSD